MNVNSPNRDPYANDNLYRNQPPAYSGGLPSQYPPDLNRIVPNQTPQQGSIGPPANIMESLTQDDIMLMKKWQQDSMYYRCLPLAALNGAALYWYNHTKQRPHRIFHYLFLSVGSIILGKISYAGELKRRIAETPLDTPYMRAMRKSLAINKPSSEFASMSNYGNNLSSSSEFSSEFDRISSGGDFSNIDSFESETSGNFPTGMYNQDNQVFGSYGSGGISSPPESSNTGKSFASYEELRAKNRGAIR